jgi:hypothetical protein
MTAAPCTTRQPQMPKDVVRHATWHARMARLALLRWQHIPENTERPPAPPSPMKVPTRTTTHAHNTSQGTSQGTYAHTRGCCSVGRTQLLTQAPQPTQPASRHDIVVLGHEHMLYHCWCAGSRCQQLLCGHCAPQDGILQKGTATGAHVVDGPITGCGPCPTHMYQMLLCCFNRAQQSVHEHLRPRSQGSQERATTALATTDPTTYVLRHDQVTSHRLHADIAVRCCGCNRPRHIATDTTRPPGPVQGTSHCDSRLAARRHK